MKQIVVVGPGGIGGTVAALLARTGRCAVTVAGRPGPHIDAIRQRGLRVGGLEEFTADVTAVDDPGRIDACDILILAVKTQHTEAALERTRHIHVRELAASLQNGTAKDEALADACGAAAVIGAVAIVAGELPRPGEVRWTYDGLTLLGELDGTRSPRVDGLAHLFADAGLTTQATDEIVSATWTKMVGWVPIGLFATLARLTNADTLSDPTIAREYVGLVRELSALAAARAVALQDLGPFHVATWNRGAVPEAAELVRQSPLASSTSTHSALQDVERGEPTELGAVVGPMLIDAERHHVPMPGVRALFAALMGLERSL